MMSEEDCFQLFHKIVNRSYPERETYNISYSACKKRWNYVSRQRDRTISEREVRSISKSLYRILNSFNFQYLALQERHKKKQKTKKQKQKTNNK
jgi:hypothetical protein